MSLDHQITKRAADGSLTIAELRQFLDEFDVSNRRDPDTDPGPLKVKARVNFRGGLKSVTVTVPDGSEQR